MCVKVRSRTKFKFCHLVTGIRVRVHVRRHNTQHTRWENLLQQFLESCLLNTHFFGKTMNFSLVDNAEKNYANSFIFKVYPKRTTYVFRLVEVFAHSIYT